MSVSQKTGLKFIAPADIDRFKCTGCGACCRLWSIPIDEASFDKTKVFLENPPSPPPNPELPWYTEGDGKKFYAFTEKGTCVFLGKDGFCYLHKHDPMLKSATCRDYPRNSIRTPRGYELYMSFSSFGAFLSVLCGPEPFSVVDADMPQSMQTPESPTWVPDSSPPTHNWDTYFLIEDILLEFIGRVSVSDAPSADVSDIGRMDSLEDALIASGRFLAAVEQEPDGKKLRRNLRDRRIHPLSFMEQPPISNLDAAYRLIERILELKVEFFRPHPVMHPVVADLLAMIRDLAEGPAEEKVGRALYYKRLRRDFYDPILPVLTPVLRKFIQYKIFEKTFFLQFGFVRGFNILCFMHALVRLRFMTRARKCGRPPAVADLFDPIHFAETHFTHAGTFRNFWKDAFQSNLLSSASLSEILVRL